MQGSNLNEYFSGVKDGVEYRNGSPRFAIEPMPDLPMKPKPVEPLPPLRKKKIIRRKKTPASGTVTHRQTAKVQASLKKAIPASSVQPRDSIGRFASNAIMGTRKVLGSAFKSTRKSVETVRQVARRTPTKHDGLVVRKKRKKLPKRRI